MSTTLTHNLLLQNIVTGTQPTTWWNTENVDRTMIDVAVAGVTIYPVTGDLTITAAVANGSARVWEFTGTPSAPANVTYAPNTSQNWVYAVNNSTQSLTFSQGAGSVLTLLPTLSAILMFDGTGAGANCTQFGFSRIYGPGTVTAPGISFIGFSDVGLYAYGVSFSTTTLGMGIAANGVEMVAFNSRALGPLPTIYGLNIWGIFQ
jgi:hypothetical protein